MRSKTLKCKFNTWLCVFSSPDALENDEHHKRFVFNTQDNWQSFQIRSQQSISWQCIFEGALYSDLFHTLTDIQFIKTCVKLVDKLEFQIYPSNFENIIIIT